MPQGGARAGAGRPRRITPGQRLKEIMGVTLEEVAPHFRELMLKMIEKARNGDSSALKFLLELPFKYVDFSEEPDTPLDYLREQMVKAGLVPLDGTDTKNTD